MRKTMWGVLFVAALGGLAASCSNNNNANGPTAGQGGVSGVVTDATSSSPLGGVTVSAQPLGAAATSTTTGSDGKYNFTFTIDSTSSVQLAYHISGYRDTSVVAALRSNSITTQNVAMQRRSQISGGGGSGIAQTIAFLGAAPPEIRVKGVGQIETATLTWEVRDSLGLPIDATHSIQLTFAITNGPGGGEFLSPTVVTTNSNGQAIMTLSSGIRAGVVQVTATGTVASGTVTTQPVRVVIDAGFPEQAHFTFGAPIYNLPVLGTFGVHNKVSVLVGDKWSNPVAPGTAVYLSSTAGVVTAAVYTDLSGQGSGDIISGNPLPLGAYAAPINGGRPHGDGYHYIAARTVGQGAVTVLDSILMLWSGPSIISAFTPTSFNIPNGGDTTFTFTVSDALGHPLAAGTTISVVAAVPPPPDPNAPVNQVIVTFGLNGGLTLPDAIVPGPGVTTFSCRLSDGNTSLSDPIGTRTTLTVFVNGPNGQAAYTIDGLVH
ncbi:MAG TPA: hypothetical protein VML00_06700 [Bacteroidota bacterium]|nr:hypothetical protein [Bacteroidota bacterium]